jgi:arylsulfatase A-like enzyme/lysophospholipase L1-like esterase
MIRLLLTALTSLCSLLFCVSPALATGARGEGPKVVVCLGDSITAGANVEAEERYPALLQQQLGDGYEVHNLGLGSATLLKAGRPNVWSRLEEALALQPDVVTIALGTNDTVSDRRENWEYIAQFERDYTELIGRFQALPEPPRILVCTPTDMVLETPGLTLGRATDLAQRRPRLQELCQRIRRFAESNEGLELVELAPLLTNKPELLVEGDGVHPNAAGYSVIAAALAQAIRPARPERPNILLFLVDDLGWCDSSVPMGEEPSALNLRYRTPNLERLAARGVRFSDAYASGPVCTPTRTSIMTGKAPARTHITYWTLHKDKDTSARREDIAAPAWQLNGLQPGEHETLPEVLRKVGYRTIHVGKAHFGVHQSEGGRPEALGFDVNIAGHASGAPASYLGKHHFTQAGRAGQDPHVSSNVWDVPGLEKYHGHDIFLTEALALEAGAALREAHAEGQPFYMNFAPYAVHAPIMGNAKYEPHYPDLDERERAYASMVESWDAALGALLTTLEELGELERTVVIFSSDNGGLSAHARGAAPDGATENTHNAPLKSGKGSAYEGGTRVPTVIAWPGVTDAEGLAGSVESTPIISHDFFPTAISLAGLQGDHGPELDGRDLTPLLSGRRELFDGERDLGWNQPHQWGASGPGIWPFTSLRSGPWKLIYFHAKRRFELYDLSRDLGETQDLAAEQPEQVLELARRMQQWIDATGAQLSLDRSTGEQVESPLESAESQLRAGTLGR